MWTSHQVWTFLSIWGENNGLQVHRDSFCANVLYFLNNDKKNSY